MKTNNVPSWATAMIKNWREKANLPENISDLEIFNILENEQISLLENTEEEKIEILIDCLNI